MPGICIVTDNTAQFTTPVFPGRDLVKVFPLNIHLNGHVYTNNDDLKPASLPATANRELHPSLIPPSVVQFRQFLARLTQAYDSVLAIFHSSELTQAFQHAVNAVEIAGNGPRVTLVDSQTISIGLGVVVQAAAEALAMGATLAEAERVTRAVIPRIYTVFAAPGLSYLHYNGFVDLGQAVAIEVLSLFPIFSIEEGHMTPIEKTRNYRQTIDFFREFIDEFNNLQHIAFIQPAAPSHPDNRLMREHVLENFADTPFTEHTVNLAMSALLGPRSMGLIIVEKENTRLR
jgi:DegV family protein with EDD domain